METMEYNTYFPGTAQNFPWSDSEDGAYNRNGRNDSTMAVSSMEGTFDSFMQGTLVYNDIDASFKKTAMNGIFNNGHSVSPTSQQFDLLPSNSVEHTIAIDLDNDLEHLGSMSRHSRSGSEDGSHMTPAQTRRKAQNRAAQRAFRERKERHVRDLESKLDLLTSTTTSLRSDIERLTLLLQRAETENEVLRATASGSPTRSLFDPPEFVEDRSLLRWSRGSRSTSADEESSYDRRRLANGLISKELSSSRPSAWIDSHLLSASATWDLLQSHPLYLTGAVDIGEVCERLKKMARCEGLGPMFDEGEVREVIEDVGRRCGDDVL